jgi:hypothetical protein
MHSVRELQTVFQIKALGNYKVIILIPPLSQKEWAWNTLASQAENPSVLPSVLEPGWKQGSLSAPGDSVGQ